MSNQYGAPTGLDLSACIVTPTGGSSSQTIAALAKSASDANAASTTAAGDATDAKTTAASALSTAKSSLQPSQAGKAGGFVSLDSNLTATVPANPTNGNPILNVGDPDDQSGGWGYINLKVGGAEKPFSMHAFSSGMNGTVKGQPGLEVGGSIVPTPGLSASCCGTASAYWNGITSGSAVDVVSDLNDKTIIGEIGNTDYADVTTKLRAVWAEISGYVYTLKNGTSGRNHVGVISQYVAAAFQKQGLDAGEFGLWCSTPKTVSKVTQNEDGTTTVTAIPVYEADGKTQATQETIRYAELLCLGIFCERLERTDLATRIAALETKAPA